jgi:hypothetical protein
MNRLKSVNTNDHLAILTTGAPEGFVVSALLVTPVVLLLTDSASTDIEVV